jgi:hypothetical protein
VPAVPPSRISVQRPEEWKRYLVKQRGQAREHIETEIAERAKRFGAPMMQAKRAAPADKDVVWQ